MLARRLTGVPFGIGPIRTSPSRPFRKKNLTKPSASPNTKGKYPAKMRNDPRGERSSTMYDARTSAAGSTTARGRFAGRPSPSHPFDRPISNTSEIARPAGGSPPGSGISPPP